MLTFAPISTTYCPMLMGDQALMPMLVFLAGAVLVVRWFRQPKRLLWLALIPVPLMVGQQLGSLDLVAPWHRMIGTVYVPPTR